MSILMHMACKKSCIEAARHIQKQVYVITDTITITIKIKNRKSQHHYEKLILQIVQRLS
jgi:hypothetical protein